MASALSKIVESIKHETAFKPLRGRVVINPNGTKAYAAPNSGNSPIPKNILNMNSAETFPAHLHNNTTKWGLSTINSTRRGPTLGTNKQRFGFATNYQIIRFIMWAYYSIVYDPMLNMGSQSFYFYRAISKLTTRSPANRSKIPVVQLYRLLLRLNRTTLIKLATIVEW
jgi:hypothetical protein